MRLIAQWAFGVFGLGVLYVFKEPAMLLGIYPLGFLCSLPVLWYVVFERHRETNSDAVVAELQTIRNAITELRTAAGSLPLVR